MIAREQAAAPEACMTSDRFRATLDYDCRGYDSVG